MAYHHIHQNNDAGVSRSKSIVNGDGQASAMLCKETTFATAVLLKKMYGESWGLVSGFAQQKDIDASDYFKKSFLKDIATRGVSVKTMGDSLLVDPSMRVFGDHWWLEKDGVILDLTADQYGHEDILITETDDSRYVKEGMDSIMSISDRSELLRVSNEWKHNTQPRDQLPYTLIESLNVSYEALSNSHPGVREWANSPDKNSEVVMSL